MEKEEEEGQRLRVRLYLGHKEARVGERRGLRKEESKVSYRLRKMRGRYKEKGKEESEWGRKNEKVE